MDAAFPAILERADFRFVAPDDLVVSVREKRRVEIDQIDRVRTEPLQPIQVVIAVDDSRLDSVGQALTVKPFPALYKPSNRGCPSDGSYTVRYTRCLLLIGTTRSARSRRSHESPSWSSSASFLT